MRVRILHASDKEVLQHCNVYVKLCDNVVIYESDIPKDSTVYKRLRKLYKSNCTCLNNAWRRYNPATCPCSVELGEIRTIYFTMNDDQITFIHPSENERVRAFLKAPNPLETLVDVFKTHLEVSVDLQQVRASDAARLNDLEPESKKHKSE